MSVFSQTETAITIDGPAGILEASVRAGDEAGPLAHQELAAIVCHPHPQHGGTMKNKVVTTLARVYRDLGIDVVRFNFRGVGGSEGSYDKSIGETEDLLAVHHWLLEQRPGFQRLLAGFSFGSAVAARAAYALDVPPRHLLLVAPPVERYDYDRDGRFPCPVGVVQGGADDVVVPEGVVNWTRGHLQSPCELLYYPEAGHFFHGQLTSMKLDVTELVQRQLEQS
ncbi:alpha/beta hydrolase [Marinimicrobium sp. ARAG 43.8]|uniref:alpha/beta hydrolase n=1 Tax=Marinimicrobium sp. ARAG 43.8 TaxID=3418719 RepID=UPI003CEAE923